MNAEYQRLEAEASDVMRQMQSLSSEGTLRASVGVSQCESLFGELGRRLASLHLGMKLIRSVESPEVAQAEREFVKALPKKFHSQGTRPKVVQLPGGVTVTLDVRYYHRLKSPKARDHGRRGLYPALLLLGISEGFTPWVKSRMTKAAALLGSYDEAAGMLAGEGICVSVNVLRTVTAGMGRMLQRLTKGGSLQVAGTVAGRRIVVTMDGGRVRLRERRQGKTKKGYKRFSPRWRELRLFMVYAVDDEGRLADDFLPVIDGSLGTCDEFFAVLLGCLQGLKLTEAARVLFVADGATWIWNRVPKLIKSLGLPEDRVQQLIDFWHAVEYLSKLAESQKLTGSAKSRWLKSQKKRLLNGEIDGVIDELKTLIGKRPTKSQKTWLAYFVKNGQTHRRMDYNISRTHHMPIGSGAIESAVRRVINLRVKSNAIYWLRDNAETMIRLRAWIKSGRSEELFQQTTCINPLLAL